MRYLYATIIYFSLFYTESFAQLSNGADSTDFTVTDLDGNTWNLYDLLDDGKTVFLDFSATWCGPCWNYHNSHALNDLYNTKGPNGSDEVMVFFIEGDGSTTDDCLYGNCNNTQGNWVAGTDYPIVNPSNYQTNQITSAYGINYFPTIYAVCPDRKVYETGTLGEYWLSTYISSCNMTLSEIITNANCGDNGTIEVTLDEGGLNPINYSWSNGSSSNTIDALAPGDYTVTVTDGNNVYKTETYTIVDDGSLEVFYEDIIDVTCHGANDGIIEIEYTSDYDLTYSWEQGYSGPFLDNLSPGDYTVVIDDGHGCTEYVNYTIFEPYEINMDIISENTTCGYDNGIIEANAYGGQNNLTYNLNGIDQDNGYYQNLPAGSYILEVTDSNNCYTSTTIFIEEEPLPQVMISDANGDDPNVLNCYAPSMILDASNSDYYQNNYWEKDGQLLSSQDVITINEAGVYTYHVIDDNACATYASITVTSNYMAPTIDAGDDAAINCDSPTTTLAGAVDDPENVAVTWTTETGHIVAGHNSLSPEVNAAGTYILTATSLYTGCLSTDQVSVTADQTIPSLSLDADHNLDCNIDQVVISSTISEEGNYVYNWTGPNNFFSAEENISTDIPGTYVLTVTNNDNNCSTTSSIIINDETQAPPVFHQGSAIIHCSNEEVSLTISSDADIDGLSILWSTDNGNIVSGYDAFTANVNASGTYTYAVTNNSTGCITTGDILVQEELNDAVADFMLATEFLNVTLISTSSTTGSTYLWTFGDGSTSDEINPTHTYEIEGTYDICLSLTNDCGTDTHCESVSISNAEFAISSDITHISCYETNDGAIDIEITGNVAANSYQWSNGEITQDISNLSAGDYTLNIIDAQGNTHDYTYTVNEPSELTYEIFLPLSDYCLEVQVSGGVQPYTYLWSDGDTTHLKCEEGSFSLTITDANGCTITTEELELITSLKVVGLYQLNVFPNPFFDYINITVSGEENVHYTIYNSDGKPVKKDVIKISDSTRVKLRDLQSGNYILKVETSKGFVVKKLVKL